MGHIINKIIDIELKAQELIKDAKREQSELPQKVSEELEERRKKYLLRAQKQIEHVRDEETKFAEEKIAVMKKEHEEKLANMKKLTDANISKWIEDAYKYITKPTDLNI